MRQVLIVYDPMHMGTFQRVTGDLFGGSVFATRKVIYKGSRAIAK